MEILWKLNCHTCMCSECAGASAYVHMLHMCMEDILLCAYVAYVHGRPPLQICKKKNYFLQASGLQNIFLQCASLRKAMKQTPFTWISLNIARNFELGMTPKLQHVHAMRLIKKTIKEN